MHAPFRLTTLLTLLIAPALSLEAPAERGMVEALRESVRGDTGKWNDTARLQTIPSPATKPVKLSLDDWADQWSDETFVSTGKDEQWLLFRTRQLDDNDRVWVQKVEKRGNNITVTVQEAVWQGYYNKNFTYYEVLALNLGIQPAGDYMVKWIVEPLVFRQFEGEGKPKDNWPKDAEPGKGEPVELTLTLTVRDG